MTLSRLSLFSFLFSVFCLDHSPFQNKPLGKFLFRDYWNVCFSHDLSGNYLFSRIDSAIVCGHKNIFSLAPLGLKWHFSFETKKKKQSIILHFICVFRFIDYTQYTAGRLIIMKFFPWNNYRSLFFSYGRSSRFVLTRTSWDSWNYLP